MATGWFQKKDATGIKAPTAPRPVTKVKISSLLAAETVLITTGGRDKNAVLEMLVDKLCQKAGLPDAKAILAKVHEREQGISTTLDTGLSLPHVRLDDLKEIVAAMALLPDGIPDPKQADLTIRVMFLFFSPNKTESFPVHLQLLRAVSSLFQPAAIDQLVASATPAAALSLIQTLEA